ncbi:MAG: PspC domain-containing protein [Acidimicrobiales bacterium]
MVDSDRQLSKNRQDGIVVGVCAGLSDYFAVDVTLVRAIFIAMAVIGGFGPVLYLVLWILLDDAPPSTADSPPSDRPTVEHRATGVDEITTGEPRETDADDQSPSGSEPTTGEPTAAPSASAGPAD